MEILRHVITYYARGARSDVTEWIVVTVIVLLATPVRCGVLM